MTISCVIPAYNRASTVGRAIESVLSQTRAPDEVIVVDDGSTDDTADVVRSYAPGITLITQDNAGVSAARNAGFHAATRDFVAFLDSDDWFEPDHLARIDQAIERTHGRATLYFDDTVLALAGAEAAGTETAFARSAFAPSYDAGYTFVPNGTEWVMRAQQPMMIQASVVRRDALVKSGGFWTALPGREDTHLFFLLGIGHPLCAVAGTGTRMSADGGANGRLTAIHNSGASPSYWTATVDMYGDILRNHAPAERHHRAELGSRLADAHRQLARIEGATPIARLTHVGRSAVADPIGMAKAVERTVRRSLSKA